MRDVRVGRRSRCRFRPLVARLESLELRRLLSAPVEVLSWHNDQYSTGDNTNEVALTPSNVNASSFGLLGRAQLDGQVYAQPLLRANVNITRGSFTGVHNVIYAATQHDSLYAIDAETGTILWQDNFTNITDPTNLTPTAGVRTIPAGSSASTPTEPYNALVNGNDVGPQMGIIATPVIDPATNIIYIVANTQETRTGATPNAGGSDVHFVQRLWAINMSNGTVGTAAGADPAIVPNASLMPATTGKILGDVWKTNVPTFSDYNNYKYYAGVSVKGTGQNGTWVPGSGDAAPLDGWIVNPVDTGSPWGAQGKTPMQAGYIVFNALLQMGRPGLTLLNGKLYMAFASHGDDGPYYGFVLGFDTSDLHNTAAFVSAPTFEPFNEVSGNKGNLDAQAGIWMSGAAISSDGTYLYLTTGNGAFDIQANNYSASYFTTDSGNTVFVPLDNDYGDCVLKLAIDPAANQSSLDLANPPTTFNPNGQNVNGYGLRVQDYFAPSNALRLNRIDADIGSGGVLLIPDAIMSNVPGHVGHHMLVTGGKEGRIYLIDRENLGGYNTAYPTPTSGGLPDPNTNGPDPSPYDRVLGEYSVNGVNVQTNQFYSTGSYFNNGSPLFYVGLAGKPNWQFNANTFQAATSPPGTASVNTPINVTTTTFPRRGTTSSFSSSGTANGIVWNLNVNHVSTDSLMAFNINLGAPIYSSQTNAGDNLPGGVSGATGVKFSLPTIANGIVYAGTGGGSASSTAVETGSVAIYGLKTPTLHQPTSFTAARTSNSSIHLAWTRTAGDQESLMQVERSLNGNTWALVKSLGNGTTTYDDTGLSNNTTYFYRVREVYASSASAYSATQSASTSGATVTGVNSPAADAAYTVGATIPITVSFSGVVNVTGTPLLALNSGGTGSYISGSGTNTLTFNYVVAAGQNSSDLDYTSTTALTLNGGTIKDTSNTDATLTLPPPLTLGSLGVAKNIVIDTFAYLVGNTLTLDFGAAPNTITLGRTSGPPNIIAVHNGNTYSFAIASMSAISANGSAGADTLNFSSTAGPITQPLVFTGNGGADAVNVNSETLNIAAGGDWSGTTLTVNASAAAVFAASQHLAALVLSGGGDASLAPGGNKLLLTQSLSIDTAGGSHLDLADNDLALDYSGATPIGSWNGSAYTGVTGLIASGNNGGAWNGGGIITSMSAANNGDTLTTLGVADASDVLGPTGGTWDGTSVDGTTVLVKYTYGGDANLDGIVNGDDYFQIDSAFPQQHHGWLNGDFNYDGVINGDDYFLIDSNFPRQGLPL